MSWLWTLLTGVLTAALGGAGMFAIGTACVKWYRISSFEGGSGYFVVALGALGVVAGFFAGLIGARVGMAWRGEAWYVALSAGVGTVVLLLLVVLAVSYLRADHEEDTGGGGMIVAWEIRLPVQGEELWPRGAPGEWPESELKLQLVSIVRDKPRKWESAEFDRGAFREEGGQWILPARVPMFTSRGKFCVNLTLGGRDDGFWPFLTPMPLEAGTEWTAWYRTNKGLGKASDAEATMYRFRFERAGGSGS